MPTPGGLIADIKASRGAAKSPGKLRLQVAAAGDGNNDDAAVSDDSGLSFGEESESDLGSLSCFSADDRATLQTIHEWMVTAKPSLTGELSDAHVCVRSIGADSGKPIVCIHGLGKDRGAAFFAGLWPGLVSAGYRVITFDMPGHGKAGGKPLAARGGKDADLVVAILRALALSDVCCLADAGGSGCFLRAFQLSPELFGPHHVLLNPITTAAGLPLKQALERHGADLLVLMADGWGATDTPFAVANCGVFFEFVGMAPERAELVILVPPRGPSSINSPGMKPMRDTKWLHGEHAEICQAVAAPLVAAVVGGVNATLFAYGQTGSGKTYTMEGPAGQEGCVQFATAQLFAALPAGHAVQYQYVQLYNDEFLDLLDPPSTRDHARKKLSIEEGKRFVCMRGATVAKGSSPGAMLEDIKRGASFRATGATNMNDASSRSHAILIVVCAPDDPSVSLGEAGAAFYLVDLAGSERTKRSGVQGKAFDEAAAINKALSALGRVVTSLVERDGQRASHISYKDNPLTQLLKSGLGGNSKTCLVACITSASDSIDESLNTLRFATQASHVKNKVAKKEAKDEQAAVDKAIATSGNALVLDANGCGVVPLSDGRQLPVRGAWGDDVTDGLPTILLIHDFGMDGSQFDGVIAALRGQAHALAPDFAFKSEKWERGGEVMDPHVSTVLELLTWLGVGKVSCIVGADFGATVAGAFKKAHKLRCAALVLYYPRLDVDEKGWAAKKKADAMFEMNLWMGPFCYYYNMMAKDEKERLANSKGIGKPISLLFPCSNAGRPDPKKVGMTSRMGDNIAKALKTELIDCWRMGPGEVAKHVLKAATRKGK